MKRSVGVQIVVAFLVSALARPSLGFAASPRAVLPQIALRATGPRVAVFVVPLDLSASQQQGALEGAAEASLAKAERFTVVPVQDAFNPAAAGKHAQAVDDARAKLKTGKTALDELDNVKATADFKEALEALQKADLTREFPALLEAWVMKAAGHATGGENAAAKKDMEAVIALSPRAEFSPTFFPPELIKFAEAQKKLANNAKGELLVRTEPPGARVWVDGQYRGVSPVTVAGLTSAKHFVTAALGGYALAQSQVSPGEAQLDLELSELAQTWKKALVDTRKDPEGQVRDTSAQAVAKAAAVDQVLLVIAKKSTAGEQLELIGVRLEATDGHNDAYRTGTVSSGDPEALAAYFDGLAAKDDKRDGRDPVRHYKGAEGADVRSIATYSLLGGGAAFIIAGIILGSFALIQHDTFLRTPQPQVGPSLNAFNAGRGASITADVFYGVGLAAIATGAVLFFTKPSSGSAPDTRGDDAKKREAEKKQQQDDEKAAAAAKQKEDDAQRREDEKKKADEARAAEEKKKDDEAAAAAAKKEEEEKKKLSKKEQAALEKKEKEEAERKAKEEERQRKEDEKRAAEEE
ncbi:MAG: PEGA domain-containing protein, partial [Archangium sp.]